MTRHLRRAVLAVSLRALSLATGALFPCASFFLASSLSAQSTPPPGAQQTQQPPAQPAPVQSVPAPPPRQKLPLETQQTLPPATRVIEFDLNGLHYFTQSRGDITVMFAHLPQQVRDYMVIEVSVSNGSKGPVTIRPEDFRFQRGDGATFNGLPAGFVVSQFLEKGSRNDVIKLVSAYEAGLYGFQRGRATSGYEQRRQSAMADIGPSRFAAAAAASALVFVAVTLKPGESTDGAIFFPHDKMPMGRGHVMVRTVAGEFVFETMPPEPTTP